MTVIVAIGCTDGVVLAADSASTDSDTAMMQPTTKLKRIEGQPILFAGSGHVGLIQKVTYAVSSYKADQKAVSLIRKELQKTAVAPMREAAQNHVPLEGTLYQQRPNAAFIFAGVYHEKPWILEIGVDGGDQLYNEDHGYFHTIGSGASLAQAVFRPHLSVERDLQRGKVAAYRIIDDAIAMAAGYLSHPIYIRTVASDGTVSEVDAGEMSQIANTCQVWRAIEREALGQALSPQSSDTPPVKIPLPDTGR